MADCTGLENRHVRKGIVGSNPTLSASGLSQTGRQGERILSRPLQRTPLFSIRPRSIFLRVREIDVDQKSILARSPATTEFSALSLKGEIN